MNRNPSTCIHACLISVKGIIQKILVNFCVAERSPENSKAWCKRTTKLTTRKQNYVQEKGNREYMTKKRLKDHF